MQLYQPHWIMYNCLNSYIYAVHAIIPTTLDHVQQFTLNAFIQYMQLYQPHWTGYVQQFTLNALILVISHLISIFL